MTSLLNLFPLLRSKSTCVTALLSFFVGLSVRAQTNFSTNGVTPRGRLAQDVANAQQVEKIRGQCIEDRRMICGKIVQLQPDGLVVDSGYTNLDRYPLNRSWLIPGTAVAVRATNVIEGKQPDSICMGLVFLTDLPRITGHKAELYDYVSLEAFPMGQYTYNSVGNIRRSIRRFSTKLPKAVEWRLEQSQRQNTDVK